MISRFRIPQALLFFIILYIGVGQQALANKTLPQRHLRVFGGIGLFAQNWQCINAWYSFYGYPTAPSISSGGIVGGDLHWGKGWRTGFELLSHQSGTRTQGGYTLVYQGSGANFTILRRLFSVRALEISALAGIGVREIRMRSERQLPATASLGGLLGDPMAVPITQTGSTLQLHARSFLLGADCTFALSPRFYLGLRSFYFGSTESRWQLNRSVLSDSPRSRIDGMSWLWTLGMAF
jgi:hypothetical protein